MSEEIKALIIYHDDCWDGLAAAWAAREGMLRSWRFGTGRDGPGHLDVKLHAAKYGDAPPTLENVGTCYIVDFSYDRETLLDMKEQIGDGKLTVLDHHKTAQANLAGLDFCHFDMSKSGARLVWEHFSPQETPPRWLLYIEDRDIWKWEREDTEAFTTWLFSQPQDLGTISRLMYGEVEAGEEFYEEAIFAGKQMLEYRDQLVARIAGNAVKVKLGDYTVYAVNTPVLQSEVGHAIAQEHGTYAAAYHHTGDGTVKFSLRSEGDQDVSQIAQLFGGGGHKNAAGFSLQEDRASTLFNNAIVKPG